jgi:pyruvate formate lyase activating enzyme
MKKAILYEKLKDNKVRCCACHNQCFISEKEFGACGVRQNINGDLYLLVYGKAISVNVDPIEKKPLFHFLPGQKAFSLGTFGCNFHCDFCQNWEMSQILKNQDINYFGEDWQPKKIVDYCKKNDIPIIAYTYNEPTIWTEYALDTMKLAKKEGIKNIWVSNGFMTEKTLDFIAPYLDAINIDLKSFSKDFYQKICKGQLEPVKGNIKRIWKMGILVEVTTLIIPGFNDSEKELKQIAKFFFKISKDLPWHISAFYPCYKMLTEPPTSKETLIRAYEIGKKIGLQYVYTGNIPSSDYESTYCPKCDSLIIERFGMQVLQNNLKNGKCSKCKTKIHGIWH